MEEKLYEDTRTEISKLKNVLLVGTYFASQDAHICDEHLKELSSLADTYGFVDVGRVPCSLKKIDSKIFIGSGKLEEIINEVYAQEADLVIFDNEISPNQQRNLEKAIKKPVIDRTELILEVFAQHAHTKEAKLQIELASVRYQLPRLKRLWTHLSRQTAGGKGFTKGEGERQIEIDRRLLKKKVTKLKRELDEVRKNRSVQRSARMNSGIPSFAIVGYTNVGKSTLLNALTNAEVLVEDKLFATLDTTTRKFALPNHQPVLLVDTVGFIRKIPHTLVAAFKSTLEETTYTDILLHLIDVNHPMAEEHAESTYEVLKELNADKIPIITVLNKIDLCDSPGKIRRFQVKYPKTVAISAKNREGFDELTDKMIETISRLRKTVELRVPQVHYSLISKLMKDGKVNNLDYEGNDVLINVEIPTNLEKEVEPFEL